MAKRIVITNSKIVQQINFIAVAQNKDPVDLATEYLKGLWEENSKSVISSLNDISPVANHIEAEEAGEAESSLSTE